MSSKLHQVAVAPYASTAIGKLNPDVKRQIRFNIDQLRRDPYAGKPLRDELDGYWSRRVGRMRIVYRILPGQRVELIAVGRRPTVYEEAARLIHGQTPND